MLRKGNKDFRLWFRGEISVGDGGESNEGR